MTLLKQQLVFLLVAFLSMLIFFLYQYDLQQFFNLHPAIQKQRLFKYGFSILFNYALISGFYLLLRKTWLTIFLSQFLVFLLTFINIQKENYLAASLVPSDFFLIKETMTASPLSLTVGVFAAVALFLAFFIWLYKKQPFEQMKLFWINGVLSVAVLSFFITANFKNNFSSYCAATQQSQFCQYTGYLPNTRGDWVGDHLTIKNLGFSTFFFSKSVDGLKTKIFQSQNISKQQIEALFPTRASSTTNLSATDLSATDVSADAASAAVHSAEVKSAVAPITTTGSMLVATESANSTKATAATQAVLPNIIFVMSESHWDATKLDASIPKNITPTIRKNQVSQLLSPSFGGGTANVEFEVLTSLNVYLNQNELMYVSKLKRPTYSLARYFNQLGYDTSAMHNNGKYFYNRSAVYQNLGFKRFVSMENMVSAADRKKHINQAGWANDDILYASIQQQLQQTDQPQFIYAISVENHPMYNDDRFGKDGYKITKPGVSDATKRQLNTYLMGMQRADDKLKQLIETVKTLDRPTMIVFFGDHLPNLQNVYDEYAFFDSAQDKAEKKQSKYFETPLAVWSNFPIDQKQLKGEHIPAHFLANKVLNAAHLPLSPYYQFMNQVSGCYPAIHQSSQPVTAQCQSQASGKSMLKAYQDLNADVINGKNWTYQLLKSANEL